MTSPNIPHQFIYDLASRKLFFNDVDTSFSQDQLNLYLGKSLPGSSLGKIHFHSAATGKLSFENHIIESNHLKVSELNIT